jgi:hypothetical protein
MDLHGPGVTEDRLTGEDMCGPALWRQSPPVGGWADVRERPFAAVVTCFHVDVRTSIPLKQRTFLRELPPGLVSQNSMGGSPHRF